MTAPDAPLRILARRAIPGAFLALCAACATPSTEGKSAAPKSATPAPPAAPSPAAPGPLAAPPAADEAAAYDAPAVAKLRAEARTLLRQQTELYWRNWVFGEKLDIAATYQAHEGLFTEANLGLVREAASGAKGSAARALRVFELYVAGEILARGTASLSDEIANLEAEATVAVGGRDRAWRDLDSLLANSPSAAERARLYAAEMPVLEKLNPLLAKRNACTEELLRALGYDGYLGFGARLRDTDLNALAELAARTLDGTADAYRKAMEPLAAAELALPLAKVRRSDVPRLFRGASVDAAFPAERMLETARALLSGLGVDLAGQKNIVLHTEALARKNPRAVCFPVETPGDVRLSVKPQGGVEDWRALFHELGHAQHFAHVARPEWEFQQLGNNTVTEAYAFLLEGLLDNPAYLASATTLRGEALARFVRGSAAQKLYMVRRYAAKLRFETAWHSGTLRGDPAGAYRSLLSQAYGFELGKEDSARYLVDHDDLFYSADYFRAWFLAAQLERHLATAFGARWWESKDAGAFLVSLWREGNRPTAEEVARAAGAQGVDPAALLVMLEERAAAR